MTESSPPSVRAPRLIRRLRAQRSRPNRLKVRRGRGGSKTPRVVDVSPIAEWLTLHPTSRVHFNAFGSFDPHAPAQFFDSTAQAVLDTGLTAVLDYHVGQVVVACAGLSDGRRVALKLYPPGYESPDVISACRTVQAQLAGRGLAVPEPIAVGETELGLVTIDEYLPGDKRGCRDGPSRIELATVLADVIASGPPPGDVVALRNSRLVRHPENVATSTATPPNFSVVVERLRAVLKETPRDTVVHLDWRVQNVAWREGRIVAVYDWDSVTTTSEAIAVGCAAGMFSYDFRDPVPHVPDPDEVRGFIDDYPRSIDVQVALAAAGLKMIGYAETERQLDPSGTKLGPRSYRTALSSHFSAYDAVFGT